MELSRLFGVEDIPCVVGGMSMLSANVKDELVKNALVIRVWNTQVNALGRIILACNKVDIIYGMKTGDLCSELDFHLALPKSQTI